VKQLRYRLSTEARTLGVPLEVVEKDYLISYILVAISTHEHLV